MNQYCCDTRIDISPKKADGNRLYIPRWLHINGHWFEYRWPEMGKGGIVYFHSLEEAEQFLETNSN